MINLKLFINGLKKSKSHLLTSQRFIGITNHNCLFNLNPFIISLKNDKPKDKKINLPHRTTDIIHDTRRFLYILNNRHNICESSTVYKGLPKSFSAPLSNRVSDHLEFKKIKTEGNLSLVDTKTPIETILPSACLPYIQLLRLNNLTGSMFLLYPCLWTVSIAGQPGELPDLNMMSRFILGAILMRSAGCIINDLMDKNFDKQIDRTKSRPLASGKLNEYEAFVALAACLTASFHVLLTFDCLTVMYGASSLLLVTLYPIMKRITNWPQLFLGLTFNWGTILGYSATHNGVVNWQIVLPLYVAGIFWTLIYDTIYAYQDYRFDKKIGLKSTTIIFGENAKIWLNAFSIAMISSFLTAGVISNQLYPYYLGTGLAFIQIIYIINKLNSKDSKNCLRQFKYSQFVGYYILMGIILSMLFSESNKPKNRLDINNFDLRKDDALI